VSSSCGAARAILKHKIFSNRAGILNIAWLDDGKFVWKTRCL
jgi:hypothetical protein